MEDGIPWLMFLLFYSSDEQEQQVPDELDFEHESYLNLDEIGNVLNKLSMKGGRLACNYQN